MNDQTTTDDATDAGSWIEWKGGDCPPIVNGRISVKLRDGIALGDVDPDRMSWQHKFGKSAIDDIVAYRIHTPA